jgi:hypothetical protein
MNKKKAIIITSSVLGAIVLGFVVYRIASRWNKEVVNDGNTTILISKEEPSDVEVVDSYGDDAGDLKETSYPEDLQDFEKQTGLGDY